MDNYKFPYTGLGQAQDIEVIIRSDELSELGSQKQIVNWQGKGDFFEAAREVNSNSKPNSKKTHSSQVLINGDPFDLPDGYVSGEIKINGQSLRIKSFKRRRNPDGTVHHLLFEVE